MGNHHFALLVPDLGMNEVTITVSSWLVPLGARVARGDRVVELLAGAATVDLSTPVDGAFCERRVHEDEVVIPGQVLGRIRLG